MGWKTCPPNLQKIIEIYLISLFISFKKLQIESLLLTVCPNGTAPMCCKVDLCVQNSCPSNPTAKCRINPCGGCKAEFFDQQNTPVDCDSGKETIIQ